MWKVNHFDKFVKVLSIIAPPVPPDGPRSQLWSGNFYSTLRKASSARVSKLIWSESDTTKNVSLGIWGMERGVEAPSYCCSAPPPFQALYKDLGLPFYRPLHYLTKLGNIHSWVNLLAWEWIFLLLLNVSYWIFLTYVFTLSYIPRNSWSQDSYKSFHLVVTLMGVYI